MRKLAAIDPAPPQRPLDGLLARPARERALRLRNDLTRRLDWLAPLYDVEAYDEIAKEGRAIAEIARTLGLSEMALAAEQLIDCAIHGDAAAMGATVVWACRLGNGPMILFDPG